MMTIFQTGTISMALAFLSMRAQLVCQLMLLSFLLMILYLNMTISSTTDPLWNLSLTQSRRWATPRCPLSDREVLAARPQAVRLAMFAGESVEQQRELLVAA